MQQEETKGQNQVTVQDQQEQEEEEPYYPCHQHETMQLKHTWNLWETYRDVYIKPSQGYQAQKQEADYFLKLNKDICSFSDLNAFAQFWNFSHFSSPTEYFTQLDGTSIKIFQGEEAQKQGGEIDENEYRQTRGLSIFKSGVKPMREDPANENGSELIFQSLSTTEEQLKKVNKLWEQAVLTMISDEQPFLTNNITGIRIVDQSQQKGCINLIFQFWLGISLESEDNEVLETYGNINNYIDNMIKNVLDIKIVKTQYKSHNQPAQKQPKLNKYYSNNRGGDRNSRGGNKHINNRNYGNSDRR